MSMNQNPDRVLSEFFDIVEKHNFEINSIKNILAKMTVYEDIINKIIEKNEKLVKENETIRLQITTQIKDKEDIEVIYKKLLE